MINNINRGTFFILTIMLTFLFGLLSTRMSYKFTNRLLSNTSLSTCDADGNHTNIGLFIHMIIFFIVSIGFFYI